MSGRHGLNKNGLMGGNRSRPDKPTGPKPQRVELRKGQMIRIIDDEYTQEGTLVPMRGNAGFSIVNRDGEIIAEVIVVTEKEIA